MHHNDKMTKGQSFAMLVCMITPEEREKERLLFEQERARAPHLFERNPMIDSDQFLQWIGIEGLSQNWPLGYLRFFPHDFIVEEVAPDNNLRTTDVGPLIDHLDGEGLTYYMDVVKIGISTLVVKDQLAELLHIDQKHIGFAGIKDRLALTSQRISIRGLLSQEHPEMIHEEQFRAMNEENFFLKNIKRGKGAVANGDLKGNRFIITIRLQKALQEKQKNIIKEELKNIKEQGFWNFFSFQRFGTPRLLSHWLGLLLLKQQYEEVVKNFITYGSVRELPYFIELRKQLESLWSNWRAIKEKIDCFPYHFQLERQLIDHLIKKPDDFLGALQTIPDQIRLWLYAYDSYLFNRLLSKFIKQGDVPAELPLITSFNPRDWEPYRDFLKGDGVTLPSRVYKDFPFVRVESRTWPTLQSIDFHRGVFRDRLALFAFTLPKGCYATTFLMNFFTLATGLPIIENIPTESIDAKEILKMGTLAPTLERFKTVLERRAQDIVSGQQNIISSSVE